jgi:hypothetical protein
MGDYAEYHLQGWIKSGMPDNQKIKTIVRSQCDTCGKEVHGKAALMQHQNVKHGYNHAWSEICLARDNERYDTQ